jgi:predicted house-cleaning noncanonical NTP pyrophosphatase (MazG superfamily)
MVRGTFHDQRAHSIFQGASLARPPKLVRDKIPEIIRRNGAEPVFHIAAPEELPALLRAKLVEEVDEFLESSEPEELADVLEVVLALAQELGVQPEDLERLRRQKAAERGAFDERVVWSGNKPT